LLSSKGFSLGAGPVLAGRRDPGWCARRDDGPLGGLPCARGHGDRPLEEFSLVEAVDQIHVWVTERTEKVSGDAMDPEKGTAKLLEFLLKDVEKGRTLPAGWDAGMPDEWKEHPSIARLYRTTRRSGGRLHGPRGGCSGKISDKPGDEDWLYASIFEAIDAVAKDDHFAEREFRVLISFMLTVAGKESGLKKTDLLQAFKAARTEHAEQGDAMTNRLRLPSWCSRCSSATARSATTTRSSGSGTGRASSAWTRTTLQVHRGEHHRVRPGPDAQRLPADCPGHAAPVQGDLIQSEERGVNFANGFVGEDLRLLAHDPKYGATFYDAVRVSRGDRCPRWMEFLHSC
jgi:hypothetical protein